MTAFSHLDRPNSSSSSTSSYVLNGSKWGSGGLGTTPGFPITYSFTLGLDDSGVGHDFDPDDGIGAQAATQITAANQIAAVEQAFAEWERVANIQFTRLPDRTDAQIDIYFVPIDGPDDTLALAWRFPVPNSPGTIIELTDTEIEFDIADVPSFNDQDFYLIALHEIGHLLGLDHPDDPEQLMYRFYTGDLDGPQVGDVAGVQEIYGPSSASGSGFSFGGATNDALSSGGVSSEIYGNSGNDTLTGSGFDDTLNGGIGNDSAIGNSGRDVLVDSFGNDTLFGGANEDNLYSPEGNNLLNGGAGNDAIRGGIGNDTLSGSAGNDALIADDVSASRLFFGDDVLIGGAGNDSLEGGLGADRFVFAPNQGLDQIGLISFDAAAGFSIIGGVADFNPGEDIVDIRTFGFSSEAQVTNALSGSVNGAVFASSGTTVIFTGVDVSDLSIDDFLWI